MHSATASVHDRMLSLHKNAADTSSIQTGASPQPSTGEQTVRLLQAQIHQLSDDLARISLLNETPNGATALAFPPVPKPKKYSGDPGKCQVFFSPVPFILSPLISNIFVFVKGECKFHKENIKFLGYNIDTKGVSMDIDKVKATMVHATDDKRTCKDSWVSQTFTDILSGIIP